MRGRPPKPTALKQLEGNPGKRALPEEPTAQALSRPPRVPSGLDGDAARFWRKAARALVDMGLLTAADVPAFEIMAKHWALASKAWRQIEQEGMIAEDERGLPRKHPLLQVWRDNSKAFREYAARFGLTPADRARVHVQPGHGEKSLAEMLFAAVAQAADAVEHETQSVTVMRDDGEGEDG